MKTGSVLFYKVRCTRGIIIFMNCEKRLAELYQALFRT